MTQPRYRIVSRTCRAFVLCVLAALAVFPCVAQTRQKKDADWDGHLVWVLPFENNSTESGLDWIGESFPDILNQRMSSAGFLTIRREDRRYAMQHLGLPPDFHPTQATAYRDMLDACLSVARCKGFDTQGFTDMYSWIPGDFPGLGRGLPFDSTYRAKPAFDSLAARLRRP